MRAIVFGGGIGGLTAGVALSITGWDVTVLERADSVRPVGSGLGLGPNAVRSLAELGLGDRVRELATINGSGGIRRPDGKWLVRTDMTATQEQLGDPVVLVHRAQLVDLLVGALPSGALRLGRRVAQVESGSDRSAASVLVLPAAAGDAVEAETLEADLVVAADGYRSPTRAALFPAHPGIAYAGYTSWRFLVPATPDDLAPAETWGDGARFAALPLATGQTYCYATANAPAGERAHDQAEGELGELRRRFGGWHDPIPRLLADADPATVLRQDMTDLAEPLPAMHAGRVALLGDAAHAMTPNLGQGACQAIEDAVVLAHLARDGDAISALEAYTAARLARTTKVVLTSRRIGRFGQVTGRAVRWRDLALRVSGLLPASAMARSLEPIMAWRPPRL